MDITNKSIDIIDKICEKYPYYHDDLISFLNFKLIDILKSINTDYDELQQLKFVQNKLNYLLIDYIRSQHRKKTIDTVPLVDYVDSGYIDSTAEARDELRALDRYIDAHYPHWYHINYTHRQRMGLYVQWVQTGRENMKNKQYQHIVEIIDELCQQYRKSREW